MPTINTELFVLLNTWYYRSLDELLNFGCLYLYDILLRFCNMLPDLYTECIATEKYCLSKTVKVIILLWNGFVAARCEREAICIVFVIHLLEPSTFRTYFCFILLNSKLRPSGRKRGASELVTYLPHHLRFT